MARLRKKDIDGSRTSTTRLRSRSDVRHQGPWDSTEKSATDDPCYVDLGSLLVRGDEGFALQLPG